MDPLVDLDALSHAARALAMCALARNAISSTPSCRGVALIASISAASARR